MIYLYAGLPWFLVLVLVWALVAGEPAGHAALLAQDAALQADNASLRATVRAYQPTAVPQSCYYGTAIVRCVP